MVIWEYGGKKGETVRAIIEALFTAGEIMMVAAQPRYGVTLRRELSRYDNYKNSFKEKEKKFDNAFYYLRKKGLVNVDYRGRQMHISLTKEGKEKAGKYRIDDIRIKKPETWDGKWRILIFDIKSEQRIKREALRGKIKELDMFQLQKSVWVYPYDFSKEIKMLRDFFGLNVAEMKIIEASKIENDELVREYFGF